MRFAIIVPTYIEVADADLPKLEALVNAGRALGVDVHVEEAASESEPKPEDVQAP